MNTNNNSKTIFLSSSDHWESWNLQFQAQAVAGGIWSQIQGVTPFLNKPSAPEPAHHKHKTPSQSTITARGSTESAAGDDDSGPANQQFSLPITTADLTADGLRTFQMDWSIYQDNNKKYTQQVEKTAELKMWILGSISKHYQLTSCDPLQSITQWYTALKEQAGISDDDALYNARQAYRQAIQPLERNQKDLLYWVRQWEEAISEAQRKKVPEALTTSTWFSDFLDAVRPAFHYWTLPYEFTKRQEVEQLTLNYLTVANDFRKEVRQARKIVRGAFGPSFASKEAAHQEDAFDDDVESGSEEGERNTGRKRKWDNSPSGRAAKRVECKCPACGLLHRLSRCYYLFPEKAPEGFEPRDHIRAKVKKALKDPQLWKKVQKLQKS
jgi:hypothetical protein